MKEVAIIGVGQTPFVRGDEGSIRELAFDAYKEAMLDGKGRLVSYTTLRYAPTGFEADLPCTIALVEFQNKTRAFGRLSKEIKEEEISIGMVLNYAVVRLSNDRVIYEFNEG